MWLRDRSIVIHNHNIPQLPSTREGKVVDGKIIHERKVGSCHIDERNVGVAISLRFCPNVGEIF